MREDDFKSSYHPKYQQSSLRVTDLSARQCRIPKIQRKVATASTPPFNAMGQYCRPRRHRTSEDTRAQVL